LSARIQHTDRDPLAVNVETDVSMDTSVNQ
jgi:hypothetical protein